MADIEKVIKCLELCRKLTGSCEGCPYENVPPVENCMLTMHGDVLELLKGQEETIKELQNAYGYLQKQFFEAQDKLLKEQEAKCLTEAEIRNLSEGQFVWIQFKTRGLYCLQIIGICKNSEGSVSFMQFDSPNDYIEVDFAKHPFRLWTGQPTEKQMDEVKWE